MNAITNHMATAELQALDAAHHMHPFTTGDEIAATRFWTLWRVYGV